MRKIIITSLLAEYEDPIRLTSRQLLVELIETVVKGEKNPTASSIVFRPMLKAILQKKDYLSIGGHEGALQQFLFRLFQSHLLNAVSIENFLKFIENEPYGRAALYGLLHNVLSLLKKDRAPFCLN